jgi:glycosyltransferase involved in cell wall biosynthesis
MGWVPIRYDGFVIPVLESMACGAAVVSSNFSAIPEVAGDAAVLVDPHSVQQNVEAIFAVLDDGRLRKTMQDRGLQRATQFTWSASAARLHEIYSSIL